MPLKLALGVRGTVVGHRLGALGGGGTSAPHASQGDGEGPQTEGSLPGPRPRSLYGTAPPPTPFNPFMHPLLPLRPVPPSIRYPSPDGGSGNHPDVGRNVAHQRHKALAQPSKRRQATSRTTDTGSNTAHAVHGEGACALVLPLGAEEMVRGLRSGGHSMAATEPWQGMRERLGGGHWRLGMRLGLWWWRIGMLLGQSEGWSLRGAEVTPPPFPSSDSLEMVQPVNNIRPGTPAPPGVGVLRVEHVHLRREGLLFEVQ